MYKQKIERFVKSIIVDSMSLVFLQFSEHLAGYVTLRGRKIGKVRKNTTSCGFKGHKLSR